MKFAFVMFAKTFGRFVIMARSLSAEVRVNTEWLCRRAKFLFERFSVFLFLFLFVFVFVFVFLGGLGLYLRLQI